MDNITKSCVGQYPTTDAPGALQLQGPFISVVPEAIHTLTVRLRALEGCCVTHVSASKAKAMKLLGGTEGKNESTARGH